MMIPKRKDAKRGWFALSRTGNCILASLVAISVFTTFQFQDTSLTTTEDLLNLSMKQHVRATAIVNSTRRPTSAPILPPTTPAPTFAPVPAPTTAAPTFPPIPAPVTQAPTLSPTKAPQQQAPPHAVAGLSCAAHGGPDDPSEMVYWRDIAADTAYGSPLYDPQSPEKYMTFEPDEGGWNNIRMALETAIALAYSMGRTLVLPPKMKFYLLTQSNKADENVITYDSFFHIDSIANEYSHFKIITFEEYMIRMKGKLRNRITGEISLPPNNRTDWSSIQLANFQATRGGLTKELWEWVRNVTQPLDWNPDKCVAAIPAQRHGNATERFDGYLQAALQKDAEEYSSASLPYARVDRRMQRYNGQPTPTNASAVDRLREMLVYRQDLCVYADEYANATTVHAMGETKTGFRLLIHWYAYLFFESWQQEVHMKRFLRDHFRYRDEIQCAAARIVQEVRRLALQYSNTTDFDTMHVRRGDFQYKKMHLSAEEMYENNTKAVIPDGRTVFIATDERNLTFFEPLARRYHLLFLKNFSHLIPDVNKNTYGMLDQIVASRGENFFGAYYSTFTGYINRLRGYYTQQEQAEGYKKGVLKSYYYVPDDMRSIASTMRMYHSVRTPFWAQEFPAGWANIDFNVDEEEHLTESVARST